jgi:hypothetical protein
MWSGVGAKAEFTVGKNDAGKYALGFNVGAGLGVGGQVGGELVIDSERIKAATRDLYMSHGGEKLNRAASAAAAKVRSMSERGLARASLWGKDLLQRARAVKTTTTT